MDRAVYDRMRRVEQDHWWFAARREILARQIAALDLPADARILEVGCGTGGNLSMLGRYGRVTGLEPDPASRAYAAERSGAPVIDGALPKGLPEPGYDLVAALDVIEHVDADAEAVAAMGALLKPGGALLTTVPAHAWLWSRHDELHHHRRRYRLKDYRRLFQAAGLKVRKASYFNSLLFPAIAFARALKALPGVEAPDDDALPPPALNGLLRRIFAAEGPLLKRTSLPLGVSILLIAERPA
jgi:SAM-dependent methyltransferase